jgi:alkanesulfonate monooxygenase SsuD/methylene tetrahydromethanopterin reductase-like flavin-dependent oxidoreductase (luciferase family)
VPDLGHELLFGANLPPSARVHEALVETAVLAEELGLGLVGFQDHPYQPAFLDAWTLLSYVAARTRRVLLFPNVLNLPLRPPAVLARSAAALDILSGGRVELGLGAGYFLDAIASMGGPDRSMGENVDALGEAITLIRSLWRPGPAVTFSGRHYRLRGARPGPVPPHSIGIWLGAYKPRMLRLTGRTADGWIPSVGYAKLEELAAMTRTIDEAAEDAGREPAEIRRAFNIAGSFGSGPGFLEGSPRDWAEQLAALALEHGLSGFFLATDPEREADLRRFAEEVAPGVEEEVAAARREPARRPPPPAPAVSAAREAERLAGEEVPVTEIGRQGQATLVAIHNHLRQELARLKEVLEEVAASRLSAAEARSYLNEMTMRQNYWTLGAFCAAYCRVVGTHHTIEDEHLFPDLKDRDASLAPVLERLRAEHEVIAGVLAQVDASLVRVVEDSSRIDESHAAVGRLGELLLDHLRYEEEQLLEPIGRLGIRV